MATPYHAHELKLPGATAGADLSSNRYRFVKASATEGQVVAIAAATDRPVGIQEDAPDAAGKAIEAVYSGITEAEAGAAIAQGAQIQTDAQGRAITLATGGHPVGSALQAAAGAGDRISVVVSCAGAAPTQP